MDWIEYKRIGGAFKAKVNPKQSEMLQKLLFNMGLAWSSGKKEVQYTESRYLIYTPFVGLHRTNKADYDSFSYNELFIEEGK